MGEGQGAINQTALFRRFGSLQDQFSVFDRNSVTRIVVQMNMSIFTGKPVTHVVASRFLGNVIDGFTTVRCRGDRIPVLHAFLYRIAGIAAGRRTGNGSDRIARTMTNLVTDQTTQNAADHRSGDPVLIFYRRSTLCLNILTLFTRRADRFHDRFGGQYFGIVLLVQHLVANDTTGADGYDSNGSDDQPFDH